MKKRKKKILIGAGTLVGVAALSVGGLSVAFATGTAHTDRGDDSPLSGSTLTRASDAALTAAGGGTVTDSERSDEPGSAYEVEVTTANGQQVDVDLDKDFAVVESETETPDSSEQPLSGTTLSRASEAALAAVGGGQVTDSERSDEPGAAYEIEVTTGNGQQVDVDLDTSFAVVKKEADTEN